MSNQKKILIADDSELTRETFEQAILEIGGTCFQAQNGNEALDILAKEPAIKLAIIDLVMPDKEGIETIREVQAQYPKTKIVAISGHSDYLKLVEGMRVIDTIEKPDGLSELPKKIQSYLEQ